MNFYFDLDDTISDTEKELVTIAYEFHKHHLHRKLQLNKTKKTKSHLYFAEMLSWSTTDLERFYNEVYPSYLETLKPKENAANVIRRLHENGHRITILSARVEKDESVFGITEKWLYSNHIPFDKLAINVIEKDNYLSNRCGYFIDDSYDFCSKTSNNNNIVVIQFVNEHCQICSDQKVRTVKNWDELEKLFKNDGVLCK